MSSKRSLGRLPAMKLPSERQAYAITSELVGRVEPDRDLRLLALDLNPAIVCALDVEDLDD